MALHSTQLAGATILNGHHVVHHCGVHWIGILVNLPSVLWIDPATPHIGASIALLAVSEVGALKNWWVVAALGSVAVEPTGPRNVSLDHPVDPQGITKVLFCRALSITTGPRAPYRAIGVGMPHLCGPCVSAAANAGKAALQTFGC